MRTVGVLLLIFCGNFQPVRPAGVGPDQLRSHASASARALANASLWVRSADSSALCEIGRGKGIVFSPDLSEPGNREFFRTLGFAYFEDPDWRNVLRQLKAFNQSHRHSPVEVLLIQSHGTNGDALKLQNGNQDDALRSYISAGALMESLEDSGVHTCLLAACNAGRLFRPENFHAVRADEGNRLFEPATLGVIDASSDFDPSQSGVTAARRAESHLEVISECALSEFAPATRGRLIESSNNRLRESARLAVPEMLIQLLLQDKRLHLVSEGFEIEKSRSETDETYREHLITRFLRFVDAVAARERQPLPSSPAAE
jgi:hypothetical protein